MSYKWCIVGDPRCGSHWLHSKLPATLAMDEILNYSIYNNFHDFTVDDKNMLKANHGVPTIELTREEFFKKRCDQINSIHSAQSVKGILFTNMYCYDYTEIIKILYNKGFMFIFLERNMFDRAISLSCLNITNFAHRWKDDENAPDLDSLNSITINLEDWVTNLFNTYKSSQNRKRLFVNYNYVTIQYDNLEEDCYNHNIPLLKESILSKTWATKYEDIITNITELRDVYNGFIKHNPL